MTWFRLQSCAILFGFVIPCGKTGSHAAQNQNSIILKGGTAYSFSVSKKCGYIQLDNKKTIGTKMQRLYGKTAEKKCFETYSFIVFWRNVTAVLHTEDLVHSLDSAPKGLDTKLCAALTGGRGGYQVVPRRESGAKISWSLHHDGSWPPIVTKCNIDALGKKGLEQK